MWARRAVLGTAWGFATFLVAEQLMQLPPSDPAGRVETPAVSERAAPARAASVAHRGASPEVRTAAWDRAAATPAFIENRGQWAANIAFLGSRLGYHLALERDAIVLGGRAPDGTGATVRLSFEGALPSLDLAGDGAPVRIENYFVGSDPRAWRSAVSAFARVAYRGLHEGVDLLVRTVGSELEYDLILEPGADLDAVVVRCEGVEGLSIGEDGSLLLETLVGTIRQRPPRTWQTLVSGERLPLACSYRLLDDTRFGFTVPEWDRSLALVVDPGLEWSTFLDGETGAAIVFAASVREDESVVVAGLTSSVDFPTTPGAFSTTFAGGCCTMPSDAFVSCIDPTGSTLLFSTYLGGNQNDRVLTMGIGKDGDLVLAGLTGSADFPTTPGAFDSTYKHCFVARMSPDGSGLLWSTFLGGEGSEDFLDLALTPDDGVVIGGMTTSPDFPVTPGAYDTTFDGVLFFEGDGFVSVLAPDGESLLASTFLGGTDHDSVGNVAVDPNGNVIVAGATFSADFPTTPGAFDEGYHSGADCFVAGFDGALSRLTFSTYVGGLKGDAPWALELGKDGTITIAGKSGSSDFPVTPGAFDTTWKGGTEGFVARLDRLGSTLLFCTFLGAGNNSHVWDIAVEGSGATIAVGDTFSAGFPVTPGAFQEVGPGSEDLFVARLDPEGQQLLYATYLGGSAGDGGGTFPEGLSVALDGRGSVIVAHRTASVDFPVTPGSWDPVHSGVGADGFITKLDLLPTGAARYGTGTRGCQGVPIVGVTAMPQVGSTDFSVTCTDAPASSRSGVLAVSLTRLHAPITVAGVQLWIDPAGAIWLTEQASNQVGYSVVPLRIPDHPSVTGLRAYLQFLWPDPCGPQGWSASAALALEVQP